MYRNSKKIRRIFRLIALILACLMLAACSPKEPESPHSGNDFNSTGATNKKPSSSNNKKQVAITFDDGPHNVRTKKIVDELAKYGFNATFFVVGNRVAAVNGNSLEYDGADAVKYAAKKGNEIAIHGYTHSVYYHKCSEQTYRSELADTKAAIQSVAPSQKVKLMRPIGGNITDERIEECPYSVILWSVDSLDWKYRDASDEETAAANVQTIVDNVMSQVSAGDIILMHDLYENTYQATKIILKKLHDQGYEVVTVSELLGGNLKAGQKYSQRAAQ